MATETNNLKLSKADSSDAIIQTVYANNNNLDIIDENISNLKTESDTKATKSELAVLTESVSGKADISYVDGIAVGLNSTMDNKADTSYVDEEVSKLNTTIATKADISYVDSKEFALPVATADTLGGIKVGANLAIDSDGTLRAIASSSGDSGDMLKSVYDTNNNGVVDNSEKLGGQLPEYYENTIPKLVGTEDSPITFAELPLDGNQVILSGYVLSNGQAKSIKDITTEIMSEMVDFLSLNEILIDYSVIVNDGVAVVAVLLWKNITGTTLFLAQFDGQIGIISGETATFYYAMNDNVLTKTNTEQYTPTAYYHPATKKYVDDNKTKSLPASSVTAGTFAGQVNANATEVANVGTAQVRNISAGTADLTAGTSALTTGEIYFVYE